MDNKLTILCDVDCVLNDLIPKLCDFYSYNTGLVLKAENITSWDLAKFVIPEHKDLILEMFTRKELWDYLSPLHESQMYLKRLRADGHKIYLVTATHPINFAWKVDWLKKYYPFINVQDIIVSHKKQMIKGDVLIDDYENNLIGGEYHKILLDWSWNRNCDDKAHDIKRAFGWSEIYQEICNIANEI